METQLRNADLASMVGVLKDQSANRFDVVAHANNLTFRNGNVVVRDMDNTVLTPEGVTTAQHVLEPTSIFDEGAANRLKIPVGYLRRMRESGKLGLLDHNLNTWLADSGKAWFLRGFTRDGGNGIARAFLSDRYATIDNLEMLLAALAGIRDAGVEAHVVGGDLSERRMAVRVVCPQVEALAPTLLAGYRSPFSSTDPVRQRQAEEHGWLAPDDRPVVFAGFVITNSETGSGAFNIVPRIMVKVCRNGLVITKDAMRRVHLGSQRDEGVVDWSDNTNRLTLDLVTSQATDAVRTFCSPQYVADQVAALEAQAGKEIQAPASVVKDVAKGLKFSDEEAAGILDHFIRGGQMTAGGVMNAVTSFSQTLLDPDRAQEVEASGLEALAMAAA